jgi:hypothetical protein
VLSGHAWRLLTERPEGYPKLPMEIAVGSFQKNLQRLSAAILCGSLLPFAGPPVLAQTNAPLWERVQAPRDPKADKTVVKSNTVKVDIARLRSVSNGNFSLLMPDDTTLNVTKSGEERMPKGLVWHGQIADEPTSSVNFSVVNQTVVGSILTGNGQSFRLRRGPGGLHILEEVDLRQLPDEEDPTPAPGRRSGNDKDTGKATCTTDRGDTIDVMVSYTAAARNGAGGKDAMEADIRLAVDLTNKAYSNSGIGQRLRLVHFVEVAYKETGNSTTDRDRLQRKGDGHLDEVHPLRDRYGADIVALIVERLDGGSCGKAFIMNPVGNAFEDHAFGLIRRDCATTAGQYSFPHELGHIMGARHNWEQDHTNNSPFAYNHGHVHPTPTSPSVRPWRTIMAYDTGCASTRRCPRVLHFSNPDVSFGGDPTGVATGENQQDNRQALNNTASTVANFRCSADRPRVGKAGKDQAARLRR